MNGRLQTMPEKFYKIVNNTNPHKIILFDNTEKIDGQSATYFIEKTKKLGLFNQYEFGVCSRNLRLKTPTNSSYWAVAKQYDIEKVLIELLKKYKAKRIVLQGKIAGEGIQKNKYHIEGYKFFAFNFIIDGKKYRTIDMQNMLKPYNINTVPILDRYVELLDTIDEMVENAQGKSTLYDTEREGKVWRDIDNNISFKVINPKFLLKNDE